MEIVFIGNAITDLEKWKKSGNKEVLQRIRKILENIIETPFDGLGKPEPLKHELAGKWSRRITSKDRIVYEVVGKVIKVYSLKGHYSL